MKQISVKVLSLLLSIVIFASLAVIPVNAYVQSTNNWESGTVPGTNGSKKLDLIYMLINQESEWATNMADTIQFIDMNFDGVLEFVVKDYYPSGQARIYQMCDNSLKCFNIPYGSSDKLSNVGENDTFKAFFDFESGTYRMFGTYWHHNLSDPYYHEYDNAEILFDGREMTNNVYSSLRYDGYDFGADGSKFTYYDNEKNSISKTEYDSINASKIEACVNVNMTYDSYKMQYDSDGSNFGKLSYSEKSNVLGNLYNSFSYDKYDLPNTKDITAKDLLSMSISEIISMMGGDYEIECSLQDKVDHRPPNPVWTHIIIRNENIIPGLWIYLPDSLVDESDFETYVKLKDEKIEWLRKELPDITEKPPLILAQNGAKVDDNVKSDMRYNDLTEYYGEFDCFAADNLFGHLLENENGEIIAELAFDSTGFTSMNLSDTNAAAMKDKNPKIDYVVIYPEYLTGKDENKVSAVDEYIVEQVRKYTSKEVFHAYEQIMKNDLSYDQASKVMTELFTNYGLTDVREGREYYFNTNAHRFNYEFLTNDNNFMACDFNHWLNSKKGFAARSALYTDGLIFNYEASAYFNPMTYVESDYPGVKKNKQMLKDFLEVKSKKSKWLSAANDTAEFCQKTLKLNGIVSDAQMDYLMDRILNSRDQSELEKYQQQFAEYLAHHIEHNSKDKVYLDGEQFGKAFDIASGTIGFAGATVDDILSLLSLSNELATYNEYSDFLTSVYSSNLVSNEMRMAAWSLLDDMKNGYLNRSVKLIYDCIKNGTDLYDTIMEIDTNKWEMLFGEGGALYGDAVATLKLATFISNLVIGTGDFIKEVAYTQGYAELSTMYSLKLREDKSIFQENESVENAWRFFEDYTILWNLRYQGESQYLKINEVKSFFWYVKKRDYKLKEDVVKNTQDTLQNARFEMSDQVTIPDSVQYFKKSIMKCPVNVYVYTKGGTLVASLLDGVECDIKNNYGRFAVVYDPWTGEYTKVICQLSNDELVIKANAIDDGLIDFESSSSNEPDTIVSFDKLRVSKNDVVEISEHESKTIYTVDYNGDGTIDVTGSLNNKNINDYIAVQDINPECEYINLNIGDAKVLNVSVVPENATYTTLDWISNDESVATVVNGVLSAVSEGTTTVLIKSLDSEDIQKEITVNVGNVDLCSNGHSYQLKNWSWDGYDKAVAVFVCDNNSTHVKEIEADITRKDIENSKRIYTATVKFNGKTYTDEKTINLKAENSSSYKDYIQQYLIPKYGNASLKDIVATVDLTNTEKISSWSDRNGIIGYNIIDMDKDGYDDLLVYIFDNSTGVNRIKCEYHHYDYSGSINDGLSLRGDAILHTVTPFCADYFASGLTELSGKTYLYTESFNHETNTGVMYAEYNLYTLDDYGDFALKYTIKQSEPGNTDFDYHKIEYIRETTIEKKNGTISKKVKVTAADTRFWTSTNDYSIAFGIREMFSTLNFVATTNTMGLAIENWGYKGFFKVTGDNNPERFPSYSNLVNGGFVFVSSPTDFDNIKNNKCEFKNTVALCGLNNVLDLQNEPQVVLFGDLDGDGQITSSDALTILRASAGLTDLTPEQEKFADIDGDGNITSSDALSVLRFSAGLSSNERIGKRIAS